MQFTQFYVCCCCCCCCCCCIYSYAHCHSPIVHFSNPITSLFLSSFLSSFLPSFLPPFLPSVRPSSRTNKVGSLSAQGAESPFFEETLRRASDALGVSDYFAFKARSFQISSDMAHAVHPNYSDRHDPNNKPR